MEELTKKVSLLGSWNEDIFSDEIIKSISARAKTEKGKKIKVTLNESGIKLRRYRFFQESKSTFFPISDLKMVTRSPEVSQCVLLILSDSERKYKIVALRCSTQADAVHLVNFSSQIQRKHQPVDVELKKKDNGNWTLREKWGRSSGTKVMDTFSDYKPNGDVSGRFYEDVEYRSGSSGIFAPTEGSFYKGVYAKRLNAGGSSSYKLPRKHIDDNKSKVTSDDFFIETEVLEDHHPQSQPHTRHNSEGKKKKTPVMKLISFNNRSEGIKRQDDIAQNYVIETEILPYQYSPKQSRSRKITDGTDTIKTRSRHTSGNNHYDDSRRQDNVAENLVIETDILPHRHFPSQPPVRQNTDDIKKMKTGRHTVMSTRYNDIYGRGNVDHNFVIETEVLPHTHLPSQPPVRQNIDEIKKMKTGRHTVTNTRYNDSYGQGSIDHNVVIETEVLQQDHSPSQPRARHYSGETIPMKNRAMHMSHTEQTEGSKQQYFGRPHVYSAQTIDPSRSIVYTSAGPPVKSQPVFYKEPPRTYDARIEPAAIFYRHQRVPQGSGSIRSEVASSRTMGESLNGKYDKRSLRSNNSKSSQSKKKRSLGSYFPTTVARSIENTYPPPAIIVRPNQILGYRPRPAAYHVAGTNDMLIYPDDGTLL